jgi:hypothetical protein
MTVSGGERRTRELGNSKDRSRQADGRSGTGRAEFPRALCHETAGVPARIASIHPAAKNTNDRP